MLKILKINYKNNILNNINKYGLYKKIKKKRKGGVRALATRKSPYKKYFSSSFHVHANNPYKPQKINKKGHRTCDCHNPFSLKKLNKEKSVSHVFPTHLHTHTFFFFQKHVKKDPLSSSLPITFHLHFQLLGKQKANLSISLFKQNKIVIPRHSLG